MRQDLPTLAKAKATAREWRQERAQQGEAHSHSAALEHVAQQLGFRDWNACVATLTQAEARQFAPGSASRVGICRSLSPPGSCAPPRRRGTPAGCGWSCIWTWRWMW